jgi:hypothetical protein
MPEPDLTIGGLSPGERLHDHASARRAPSLIAWRPLGGLLRRRQLATISAFQGRRTCTVASSIARPPGALARPDVQELRKRHVP